MQVKAVVVSELGGSEQLQLAEAGSPVPGEGQVRIAVHVAGVNPVDAGNRSDGSWAGRGDLPRTSRSPTRPELARALNNLGIRYSDAGDKETALTATTESTAMRRQLADAFPDRYRADLASSLGYLGIRYAESDRLADALPIAEEAVTLYRQPAETLPDRYRSDLANALDTFADLLEASGQQSRAQTARTETATLTKLLNHGHRQREEEERR